MRRIATVFACVILLTATGCADVLRPAAAVVNGRRIPESRVEREVSSLEADPNLQALFRQEGEEARGDIRRQVLLSLIRFELVEAELERRNKSVTEKDVDEAYSKLAESAGGEAEFQRALEAQQINAERARVLARRQAVLDAIESAVTNDVDVPEEQIRGYYEGNRSVYAEVELARATFEDSTAAGKAADAIASGASLEAATKKAGGEYAKPQFTNLGGLDAASRAEVEATPPGGVTAVVEGPFGFTIYAVGETRTAPLDEVREDIAKQLLAPLRQQLVSEFLTNAVEKADIKINPKYGEFDPATDSIEQSDLSVPR